MEQLNPIMGMVDLPWHPLTLGIPRTLIQAVKMMRRPRGRLVEVATAPHRGLKRAPEGEGLGSQDILGDPRASLEWQQLITGAKMDAREGWLGPMDAHW